jgi:hypothetical protein
MEDKKGAPKNCRLVCMRRERGYEKIGRNQWRLQEPEAEVSDYFTLRKILL